MICQEKAARLLCASNCAQDPLGLREGQTDLFRISCTMSHLELTGWYWGALTSIEARQMLNQTTEGTFLVRDSSNPQYLLTLSVKTSSGPAHLRIEYSEGKFGFDSVVLAKPKLKNFDDVVDLVQHYVSVSKGAHKAHDQSIAPVTKDTVIHLKLTKPLYVATPSLQHLCRIIINKSTKTIQELPLPTRLKEYLLEYPFHL
ncbi:suppressor of cytokine signaling 2-like [Amblyraja radiata]|uniref:suppressor of cytokine signaling 2-like n=1 Tax=Amblyraja radiata TaxID=386614 RepID=UPI001402BC3A|nr:suppressor of cytokine signaling 2-like [Amblyraja radiata]XP_032898398.1 suppressor of cytokine signaling 2-like [Amblyraja radiata]XP_032898399.1 suppressor of cytokine signaling 2-like [Amblyraja radiata]